MGSQDEPIWAPFDTLFELVVHQGINRPETIALDDGYRTVSYRDLQLGTVSLMRGLRREGLKAGDRIGYLGRNRAAWFELLLTAAGAGAVAIPISWRLPAAEIEKIIVDAGLTFLFVEEDLDPADLSDQTIVRRLKPDADGLAAWRSAAGDALPHPASPDDVVLQIYTSGTTGNPKGVMLSHRNLLQQRFLDRHHGLPWARWAEDEVSLISMPVAHVSGTGWGLYGLIYGARNLIVRDFVPSDVLRLLEREGVTKLFVVPAALQGLAEAQEALGVRLLLRDVLYGGAPIGQPLLETVRRHFPCRLVQLYGMTESSGAAVALWPDDHLSNDPSLLKSAGRPLPGVELAVADLETGTKLSKGIGEILIRGAGLMAGYWQKQAETAAAIDSEGWLHSGDIGTVSDNGVLTVVDRLRDMVITGGENVYPAEVEDVLRLHPAITEVAVAGLPDSRWGEAVSAFVIIQHGASLDREALRQWSKARLADYKVPTRVKIVDELPRNASGKIMRRELRRLWSDEASWSREERGGNQSSRFAE